MTQFQIHRSDLSRSRVVPTDPDAAGAGLQSGEALVRVESFGFSANNVTYAVLGDRMNYWKFFPAQGSESDQWGLVPVWGYGEVLASQASSVEVGQRFFGYFPTATHVVMRPEGEPDGPVVDTVPHRSELPAGYNRYAPVPPIGTDQERTIEDLRMLLYPLYLTSWAIGDLLETENWFGAEQIVITSASSKTAIGVAYALRAGASPPPMIGLTSAGNRAFVEGLGLYDRVVLYDQAEAEVVAHPTVIVDLAGDGPLLGRLHSHLGPAMLRTLSVGITHWEDNAADGDVIGDRTEFFFAPHVIAKRAREWGMETFIRRTEDFIRDASAASATWLKLEETHRIDALGPVYDAVRTGSIAPEAGNVIRTEARL